MGSGRLGADDDIRGTSGRFFSNRTTRADSVDLFHHGADQRRDCLQPHAGTMHLGKQLLTIGIDKIDLTQISNGASAGSGR